MGKMAEIKLQISFYMFINILFYQKYEFSEKH